MNNPERKSGFEYFVVGSTDEFGTLVSPNSSPFDTYRVETLFSGPFTVLEKVTFWDPNDQTWNDSLFTKKSELLDDILQGGGWVRKLLGEEEYPRAVPNYDKEKFGA